jgi:hypothetical protein
MEEKNLTYTEWLDSAEEFAQSPYEVHGFELREGHVYPVPGTKETVRIGTDAMAEPCFVVKHEKETYVTDRRDRAECWLWERLTGRRCPLHDSEIMPAPPGYQVGSYPFAKSLLMEYEDKEGAVTLLTDLVMDQVEVIFNENIGARDGFGDAQWLNFNAINALWGNKTYRQFQDNGVALYKHDGLWQLILLDWQPRPSRLRRQQELARQQADGCNTAGE